MIKSTDATQRREMKTIATEQILFESPDAENIYCYSPGITRTETGRLIATFGLGGPGAVNLPGMKTTYGDFGMSNQGKVLVSDDHGETWRHTADLPMMHARSFVAGATLYIIGHNGVLSIVRSDDAGETWSEASVLEDSEIWHQAPCAVDYRHGKVYLTMEIMIPGATWPGVALVLMSADVNDDLLKRENWVFSNKLVFPEKYIKTNVVGTPFYSTGFLIPDGPEKRFCGDPCWLESHVVRIYDPEHNFYDPEDRTVYLWMRAHTGLTNIGAIARGKEADDGSLTLDMVKSPAGSPMLYISLPGGQMKFHIVYDEITKLYWLLSTQATDSMTRPELLPDDRYGLPNNERQRLQLHFSKNLFDWCFAGIVADGGSAKQSRHYAGMTIDGEDLCILSRSGDRRAKSAHNGNLVTFHKINKFRELVY
jgi:hypothetical protein